VQLHRGAAGGSAGGRHAAGVCEKIAGRESGLIGFALGSQQLSDHASRYPAYAISYVDNPSMAKRVRKQAFRVPHQGDDSSLRRWIAGQMLA